MVLPAFHHMLFVTILQTVAKAQVFQMFVMDQKGQKAHVLDTVKLPTCAHVDLKRLVTLRGGIKAGNFSKLGLVRDMQTCVDACCQDSACDVAFMPGHVCYTVDCFSEKLCETIPAVPSKAANGSVQISHIVRGGGNGDDIESFKRTQGIDKYSHNNGKADHCTPSRIAYNHTLRGGKMAGVVKDLGILRSVHNCVDKCCEMKSCEIAFYLNRTCYAIDCYAKELCQSVPVERNKNFKPTIVYMNKRNGVRQENKDVCSPPCKSGLCSQNNRCMCDRGFEGTRCNETARNGYCGVIGCGYHGECSSNDTCACEPGYFGHLCDETLSCSPACAHGLCLDNSTNSTTCKCEIGWEGQYCNVTNGDRLVSGQAGEQVIFTKMDQEAEMDIKIHDAPNFHTAESISALAVAIGCGVAAAVVGTAAVAFIARRIMGKKFTTYELLREPLHQT